MVLVCSMNKGIKFTHCDGLLDRSEDNKIISNIMSNARFVSTSNELKRLNMDLLKNQKAARRQIADKSPTNRLLHTDYSVRTYREYLRADER